MNKNFKSKSIFSIRLIGLSALLVLTLFTFLVLKKAEGVSPAYPIHPDPTEHWAWNDIIGWIDFNYSGSDITVSSEELTGVASSSWGPIYLNCEDSPFGCTPSFRVTNSNHVGTLDLYAWNDVFGWLRFKGSGHSVLVRSRNNDDTPPSDFEGWAWNPVIGWVSFNCRDISWTTTTPNGYCNNTSTYKVSTDWYSSSTSGWLESAIFDTEVGEGVQFNSISWRGDAPVGTRVAFYFAASSTPSGPWTYEGPYYSGTTSLNPADNLLSAPLDYALFNNARYFRYKVVLFSDSLQTVSPVVEEVIVNWSP